MPIQLLPPDFDQRVAAAIQAFWLGRSSAKSSSQGGTRDGVLSGKNLDGFLALVQQVAMHCGLPDSSVLCSRGNTVLPGYFRPTKNWDVLVIHRRRLVAAFEFKSQVGSFGNNFNNRSEEVIGAAADLWVAHHHGAHSLDPRNPPGASMVGEPKPMLHPDLQRDPRPPFLGWVMLLEDSEKSTTPVRCEEPHFPVFPEFRGASYARRYQVLCERLMERQLYAVAALVLSKAEEGAASGQYRSLSAATSLRTLFTEFAAKVAAAVAEAGG
jgi:hypothetical protein